MSALPTFSSLEVAAHSRRDDLHVSIAGKVYDVTEYLRDHPGGVDVLLDVAGQDATEAYNNVGHSAEADEVLASYLIGTTETSDTSTRRPRNVKLIVQDAVKPTTSGAASVNSSRLLQIGAGTLTLVGISYLGSSFGPTARRILSSSSDSTYLVSPGPVTNTFIGGFLISTLLSTLGATIVAKKLAKFAHIESGFAKYPPRRKQQRQPLHPTNPHLAKGFLDPKAFKSLELIRIDHVSPNVRRYTFKLPNPDDILGLPIGQHVALKATLDGKTITRSYTPTSNNLDKGILQLLIKLYPDALLTTHYLAHLTPGDHVLFRGPKGAYTHNRHTTTHIGMIAGGTGITPMYQLIRAICEDEYDTTRLSLVFANRTEPDILLRAELESFARRYPANVTLWFLLDEPPETDWAYGVGFVTPEVMKARLPGPGEGTKVLVCGPPGMVGAAKKGLVELGFRAPGAVASMADEVFCF